MAIQTTANLDDSIRAQYDEVYYGAARLGRVYDQFSSPVPGLTMEQAVKGSSVVIPFLSSMTLDTDPISQTADVTPTVLVDADTSVTPTSRKGALQWSELLDIQAYTDYGEARFKKLGENMMQVIELLAIDAATQGAVSYTHLTLPTILLV